MRVRDHVVLSTAGAVLLSPWLRSAVLGTWGASILIDVDHYLWFCVHQRRLDPFAAVRFFNEPQVPRHRGTRLLHSPAVLLLLLVLGPRRRGAALVWLGLAFHIGLDAYHEAREKPVRSAALRRDRFTCQRCGVQGRDIVTHLWRQPWVLPSYRMEYFISMCRVCHSAAHAGGMWHNRSSVATADQRIVVQ